MIPTESIIETPLASSEREALGRLAERLLDEGDYGHAVLIWSALWNLERVEQLAERRKGA